MPYGNLQAKLSKKTKSTRKNFRLEDAVHAEACLARVASCHPAVRPAGLEARRMSQWAGLGRLDPGLRLVE